MNLFSDQDKLEIENLYDSVHESFARTVYYYKTPTETVLVESANHNAFYSNAKYNTTVSRVQETGSFSARILHGNKQNVTPLKLAQQDSKGGDAIFLEDGEVRLKVDAIGKEVLDNAVRFQIDDFFYQKNTSVRPFGIFSPKYYTYYLKRIS